MNAKQAKRARFLMRDRARRQRESFVAGVQAGVRDASDGSGRLLHPETLYERWREAQGGQGRALRKDCGEKENPT